MRHGRPTSGSGAVELRAKGSDLIQKCQILMLGPFEVQVGDASLRLGRHRRLTFALLALRANDIVPVDDIVDALWANRPPSRARHQIQVYICALRGLLDVMGLDRACLKNHHDGYRLRIPQGIRDIDNLNSLKATSRKLLDVGDLDAAYEHLRQAAALFRGRPLDGVDADFARWEAVLLEEHRLALIIEYSRIANMRGRPETVIPDLFKTVHAYPLNETLREQLMLALYLSGRSADALAVYRDGRGIMIERLGIEPSPALRHAEAAILRGEPLAVGRPAEPVPEG